LAGECETLLVTNSASFSPTPKVYLTPTSEITLKKGIAPIKLYHALYMKTERVELSYGQSLDPIVTHASFAADLLDTPSVDPSPPLPWYDRVRQVGREGEG
jgi:hypothetical protein